jgi:hypothetical protein
MAELNRYEDADSKRWYDTPVGKLPSATTVLKCLAKPALIGWAAKTTAEHMRGVLADIGSGKIATKSLTEREIDRLVKEAKAAHRKTSTEAMDLGSAMHAWIEIFYNMKLAKNFEPVPALAPEIQKAIDAFLVWTNANDVRPICVEERIWSSARFAGTLDLYAEVKGVPTLIDFKSSTGHWEENVMQLGAYDLAFRERTGNKVDGYMVVRLDKLTGVPDPKAYSREDVELGCKRFLAVLEYFWLTEAGKE